MKIEDIQITTHELFRAEPIAVKKIQSELNCEFPSGYVEYITTLGEGVFADYVRIYPPHRIRRERQERKERLTEYWFWDTGPLGQQQAIETVGIGDTVDGDDICFHPSNNQKIYILPRFTEESIETGPTLWATLEWMFTADILTETIPNRDFIPFSTIEHDDTTANK